MAKKDIDTDINDEGFEPDDQDDFDNFNFDNDMFDPDSREPAKTPAQYGITFAKEVGTGYSRKLLERIGEEMPNTRSVVSDALNIKDELFSLKDEASEQVGAMIRDVKKGMRPLLPYAEKILPSKIYKKIDDLTQVDDDNYTAKTKEQERTDRVTNEINNLFGQQTKLKEAELTEERTNRIYDTIQTERQHKEGLVASSKMYHELQLSNAFLNTSLLAYLKKSLELKYRHLFVSEDALELSKATLKLLEVQLPKISHNTNLPDFVKITKKEIFLDQAQRKMADTIQSKIRSFLPHALKTITNKITTGLKDSRSAISDLSSMTGMLEDEMMQEMMDPKEEAIKAIGSGIGGWLTKPLARRIKVHYGPEMEKAEEFFKNPQQRLFNFLNKKRDDFASLGLGQGGFLKEMFVNAVDSMMPGKNETVSVAKQEYIDNPYKATPLDISMRQSIVEIIPGYLAKILKQVTDFNTGEDNEELIFDQQVGNFSSQSDTLKRISKSAFNNKNNANKVNESIGKLRALYLSSTNDNSSLIDFDDQYENLRKFMFNSNLNNKTLDAKELEEFIKTGKETKYIKTVFEGIDNPIEVAKILLKTSSSNDQIDKHKHNKTSNIVMEASKEDEHFNKLRKITDMSNYTRLLDDFGLIENRENKTANINKKWIEDEVYDNQDKDELSKKARILREQYNQFYELRKTAEAKRTKTINKFEHVASDKDNEEVNYYENLANSTYEEMREIDEKISKRNKEKEDKEKEKLLQPKLTSDIINRPKKERNKLALPNLDLSSFDIISKTTSSIETILNNIYSFLTAKEEKVSIDINAEDILNKIDFSKFNFDISEDLLKSKFSFLEDILLDNTETTETYSDKIDASINKIYDFLVSNKTSSSISSNIEEKMNNMFDGLSNNFTSLFSSLSNNETFKNIKDKTTSLTDSLKNIDIKDIEKTLSNLTPSEAKEFLLNNKLINKIPQSLKDKVIGKKEPKFNFLDNEDLNDLYEFYSDNFANTEEDLLKSKFSFLEDILLDNTETTETYSDKIDASINKIYDFLVSNKTSSNISSNIEEKMNNMFDGLSNNFSSLFSSLSNNETFKNIKDKVTNITDQVKEFSFKDLEESLSNMTPSDLKNNLINNPLINSINNNETVKKIKENKTLQEAKKKITDPNIINNVKDSITNNKTVQNIVNSDTVKQIQEDINNNKVVKNIKEKINSVDIPPIITDTITSTIDNVKNKIIPNKPAEEPKFNFLENEDLNDIYDFYSDNFANTEEDMQEKTIKEIVTEKGKKVKDNLINSSNNLTNLIIDTFNEETNLEDKESISSKIKSLGGNLFNKIKNSKLMQEDTGSVDLTFLRNLVPKNIRDKRLSHLNEDNDIIDLIDEVIDDDEDTININELTEEEMNQKLTDKISSIFNKFKKKTSDITTEAYKKSKETYNTTKEKLDKTDTSQLLTDIKDNIISLVRQKKESQLSEDSDSFINMSSISSNDETQLSMKEILDEMRKTLSAHMLKSSEDRTNIINLLTEMSAFDYHQGDPKKADGIFKRSAKFAIKAPFKIAGFGFKTSWAGAKLAGKTAWGAAKLGASAPGYMHKKFKDLFGPQYISSAIKAPFKLGFGAALLPFKAAKGIYNVGKSISGGIGSAFDWSKDKIANKFGRKKHSHRSDLPNFFDVYKAGTHNVILFEEVQEGGVLLQDGTPLKRTVDINQPVISTTKPANILVSQKDIDEGLTNEEGIPLHVLREQYSNQEDKSFSKENNTEDSTNDKKQGLLKRTAKGAWNLTKGAGRLSTSILKNTGSIAGAFMTPMNRMMLDTLGFAGKGIGAFAKGTYNTIFGKGKNIKDERIVRRLDTIIELLGGEPPSDDEEKKSLFSRAKSSAKSFFNNIVNPKDEEGKSRFSKITNKVSSMGKDVFNNIKNSRLVQEQTGSLDLSFLNKLVPKQLTNKPKTDTDKHDHLQNNELDDLLGFYKDRFGDSEDDGTDEAQVELQSESNSILSKILDGINKLVKIEEKEGKITDRDGDGKDDGKKFGWGKYNERKKKKLEAKVKSGKDGKDGKSKTGSIIAGAIGGKDNKNDKEDGGIISTIIGTSVGTAIIGWLTKSALLQGIKAALMNGLSSILGPIASFFTGGAALTAGAVVAAGAAGVAAGVGINKITQHYSGSSDYGKTLLAKRKQKYGVKINGKVSAIKDFFAGGTRDWVTDLEKVCLDYAEAKQPIILSDSDKKEFISNLGWPLTSDAKHLFDAWFNGRFVPIFQSYIDLLKANGLDYYSANNAEVNEKDSFKLTKITDELKVPNEKLVLDVFNIIQRKESKKSWTDPLTGAKISGDKPTPEELKKREDELQKLKDESIGGEETRKDKSWWNISPIRAIKESIAQKRLDDVAYDAQYKFTGDQAKLFEKTKAWIKGHEGLRLKAYRDSRGLNTIGYGHLNSENYSELTKQAADKLFEMDMDKHIREASKLPEYSTLDPVRQMALVNLVFNMGRGKFEGFKKTRQLLAEKKFPEAASELLKSDYADQVGDRAKEVANVIKSGNPDFIKPKAIGLGKDEKSMLSAQDQELLSNKQFSDPNYLSGTNSTNMVEKKITAQPPSNESTTNTSTTQNNNTSSQSSSATPYEVFMQGMDDGLKGKNNNTSQAQDVGQTYIENKNNNVNVKEDKKIELSPEVIAKIPPGKEGVHYKKEKPDINIDNMNPTVQNNFKRMAFAYKAATKKPILVTSGYRSIEEQAELYRTMPKGKAAKPGSSLHNFGYALDINTPDAEWLDKNGYLAKFGFHRNLLGKGETWHIEPKGINRDNIRSGKGAEEGKDPKSIKVASNKDNKKEDKAPSMVPAPPPLVIPEKKTEDLVSTANHKSTIVDAPNKPEQKVSTPNPTSVAMVGSTGNFSNTNAKKVEAAIEKEPPVTKTGTSNNTPVQPIKVDVNNKDVVTETAKTNMLLSQLINLFIPVADHLKKNNATQVNTAASNNINQPIARSVNYASNDKVVPVIDTRRRS